MKRIAIADIHLSEYYTDKIIEGLPQRLYYLKKALDDICNFAIENEISYIDILGDLNNDKSVISTDAQNVFKEILVTYRNLHFSILSGNHDLSSAGDNQTSSISVFGEYPNVTCYESEMVEEGNITFIPYTNNIVECIKSCDPNKILLSHIGLSEGVLQSGISIVSDITIKDFREKFDLALFGHYHMPQEIKKEDISVFYIGTPIHLSWRDKNQKKRFLVYDTDTLEVQSYKIAGFPEYKEFQISESEKKDSVLEEAKSEKENGNFVRIHNTSEEEISSEDDFVVINDQEEQVTDRGVNQSMGIDTLLERYIEMEDIEDETKKKYLKDVGLEIVNESESGNSV